MSRADASTAVVSALCLALLAGCGPGPPAAAATTTTPAAAGAERSENEPPRPAPLADGAAIFSRRGCVACHRIGGSGGAVGPALDQLAARRAREGDVEAYVRASIRDPQARVAEGYPPVMPVFSTESLSDGELDVLAAWLLER